MELGHKDAIHVPFIIVKCDTLLNPGDKCSLRGDGTKCVKWDGNNTDPLLTWHGVVDPFLMFPVCVGEFFRLMIRKECYSNLYHDFDLEIPGNYNGGTENCHLVCNIEG